MLQLRGVGILPVEQPVEVCVVDPVGGFRAQRGPDRRATRLANRPARLTEYDLYPRLTKRASRSFAGRDGTGRGHVDIIARNLRQGWLQTWIVACLRIVDGEGQGVGKQRFPQRRSGRCRKCAEALPVSDGRACRIVPRSPSASDARRSAVGPPISWCE